MGKYIKMCGIWYFVFETSNVKVTDEETLKKLKKVKSNSIELFELWRY